MITVTPVVDGRPLEIRCAPGATLLEALRDAGIKGVKDGCATGDCGACAVLVDGRAVNACYVFAARCDGAHIETAEGLASTGGLHPLQQAFLDTGAVQCGFCTPGMLVVAVELLRRTPDPDDHQIREALAGSLCRCTGYVKPVEAIRRAAEAMSEAADV